MMHVFENSLHINITRLEQERLHLFLERVCIKKKRCWVLWHKLYYLQLWV